MFHSDEHPHVEPDQKTSLTEKTRLILACLAALLAILAFVAFIVTGDVRCLLGTSVLAYPLFKVIDYYFTRFDGAGT